MEKGRRRRHEDRKEKREERERERKREREDKLVKRKSTECFQLSLRRHRGTPWQLVSERIETLKRKKKRTARGSNQTCPSLLSDRLLPWAFPAPSCPLSVSLFTLLVHASWQGHRTRRREREREREMSWASSTSSSFLVCGNGLWQCREVASGCDWEKEERSLFLSYPILEDRRPRVLREREGRIFSLLFGVVFTDFCSSFFPPSSSPSFSFFPQKV